MDLGAPVYVIRGSVIVTSDLTLHDSNLIINGNLTLSDSSKIEIVSNRSSSLPINVSGCVDFGGDLVVYLPADYDSSKPFEVASYSCSNGQFTNIAVKSNGACSGSARPDYSTLALSLKIDGAFICDAPSLEWPLQSYMIAVLMLSVSFLYHI